MDDTRARFGGQLVHALDVSDLASSVKQNGQVECERGLQVGDGRSSHRWQIA
jgi:hypothetical protein